ncbi:MAG: hypothetical protein AAGC95_16360 [Pseudomonadota bacterium]
MRRPHRSFHVYIWMLLLPALIAAVIVGVSVRKEDPVNAALPDAIAGDAE